MYLTNKRKELTNGENDTSGKSEQVGQTACQPEEEYHQAAVGVRAGGPEGPR